MTDAGLAVLDVRDLPAPEPFEQILLALARLEPGQGFVALTPRVPRLLLPRLEQRGFDFTVREEADGTAAVTIRRPA